MFTQEFPKQAAFTLLGIFKAEKPPKELIALAAYDLLGYGLGKFFGDPKYPMTLDIAKLLELLNSPEYAKAKEAVLEYYKMVHENGTARWLAALRVIVKYGPSMFALVLKALEAV